MASKPRTKAGGIAAALVASAAGLALVAGAASAQPGGGNGNGKGNDKGGKAQAAQSHKGQGNGGGGGADKGANKGASKGRDKNPGQGSGARPNQQASAKQHGNGNDKSKSAGNSGKEQRQTVAMHSPVSPANDKNNGNGAAKSKDRDPGNGPGKTNNGNKVDRSNQGKANSRDARQEQAANTASRPRREDVREVSYKGSGGRSFTVPTNDRVRVVTSGRSVDWSTLDRRRAYDGCPPGLAKKYNGCTPPGLARKADRSWQRTDWYGDWGNGYRYSDGYMLRTGSGGSSILSYIPLLAGALAIGNVWPGSYESAALPDYYDSYYDLGGASDYRYYDDTIYRVDSGSSEIESIAALLTGNQFTVGEPMPVGYDVYNVPYDYRDQYYDTPEANYRYSDGYIYQLDPTTQLVQAAIELLT